MNKTTGQFAGLDVEITRQSGDWDFFMEKTVLRAVLAACQQLSVKKECCELNILLADDRFVRSLNRKYRGKDKPTNVLSFPVAVHPCGTQESSVQKMESSLGDIVLAFETVQLEAVSQGKSFEDHLAHLAVHGVLHLLGYDHEKDPDARIMENLEREILEKLGIRNPYAGGSCFG